MKTVENMMIFDLIPVHIISFMLRMTFDNQSNAWDASLGEKQLEYCSQLLSRALALWLILGIIICKE